MTVTTSPTPSRAPASRAPAWLVPTGLIVLSLVPVLAGAVRVASVTGGAETTPENARFMTSPVPILAHVVGASVYLVLGAFQFVPGLRRRRWHRIAGRILVPCGLAAALSAIWMTLFYDVPAQDHGLLTVLRLVFASAMATAIVLAFLAIRRRDVTRHSAWMTRGYAIGAGAGTQAVIQLPITIAVGAPTGLARTLLLGAGWVVNLAVAEWVIRRRSNLNG
jgi:hypothetical protein